MQRPADQRADAGQGRRHPRVGRVVGLEHVLGLGRRVRVVHLLDVDDREHRPRRVAQGEPLRAARQRLGGDREDDRERPDGPVGQPPVLDHGGVVGAGEEPGQRRERADCKAFQVGEPTAVQPHRRQAGRLRRQRRGPVGGDEPLDEPPAVRDRRGHGCIPRAVQGRLPSKACAVRPTSSSSTRAADSSGDSVAVSSASSGASGGS